MSHLVRAGIRPWGIVLACGLALTASAGRADEPTVLRVNAFPQAKTLPLHAGIAKGIFEKRGFKIELHLTDNSRNQRDGLAAGKFDVVHSAVDNALAMIEVAKHDVVIVTGGDSGMNEFFVQPDDQIVRRHARPHPRGRCARHRLCAAGEENPGACTGSRTAPTTRSSRSAPASTASRRWPRARSNAAAILNLPFTVQAERSA